MSTRRHRRGAVLILVSNLLAVAPALAPPEREPSATRHACAQRHNCGLQSLKSLVSALGSATRSDQWLWVVEAYSDRRTLSFEDLRDAAALMDTRLTGWQATTEELRAIGEPGIVHHKGGHFSTLLDVTDGKVRWLDGGLRMNVTPIEEFAETFSGYCLLPAGSGKSRQPSAQVRFLESDHDAGRVARESMVTHAFECTNVGRSPHRIGIGRTSSQCTAAVDGSSLIHVGESRRIELAAPGGIGHAVHWAQVVTSDPATPIQYLTMRAYSPRPVSVSPPQVTAVVERGQAVLQTLRVRGPVELVVEEVAATPEFVTAAVDLSQAYASPSRDVGAVPVLLSIPEDAPVGVSTGQVTIKTNDPRSQVLAVPMTVDVRGKVRSRPSQLFFGFVTRGSSAKRQLRISAPQFPGFRVQRVEYELAHIILHGPTRASARSYTIDVTISPTAPPGVIDGNLYITTNVPGEERVGVPLYAHVTQP